MSIPGIHHIALRVKDCLLSARFYSQAFGLPELRRVEKDGVTQAVWIGAGPTVLMLEHALRGSGADHGSGHVLIFPTTDLAHAEMRFVALGVPVVDRTLSTLYVTDPDGHRTGVSIHPFEEITP